ncbi:MAG TPA: methyltransferase domain-containing protein [Rubrobacteraceae bacterium]|nr:methyltransferase domain-containing protein [Rubrobacteraceae bacterium]
MAREWDAAEYEALSGPQTCWGANLLGLLERQPLRGDETVIDAGCGTGRVTELLLRHIPDGMVLAVDASEAMVEAASRRFAGDPRVRVERQDLLRLEAGEPVDLIFSSATFHWIKDHEKLFDRLFRALKPGGRLVAQCGGKGNIARVTSAAEEVMREKRFRDYFEGWEDPKEYADAKMTRARLEAAGFEQVETWLHDEPTLFGSVEELARFLKAVVLGQHLLLLPEAEHEPFAAAVAAKVASVENPPVMDYVRLNMLAARSGADEILSVLGNERAGKGELLQENMEERA